MNSVILTATILLSSLLVSTTAVNCEKLDYLNYLEKLWVDQQSAAFNLLRILKTADYGGCATVERNNIDLAQLYLGKLSTCLFNLFSKLVVCN